MPKITPALLCVSALSLTFTACHGGTPAPEQEHESASIHAEPVARPAAVPQPAAPTPAPLQAAADDNQPPKAKSGSCCGAEMCKRAGGNCGCNGNAKGCGG